MLHQLHLDLARRGVALRIVGARGRVRDLLRAEGIGEKVGGLDRLMTLDDLLGSVGRQSWFGGALERPQCPSRKM